MNVNLKIWRQGSDSDKGTLKNYRLENIDPNISFLEMLDILNIKLVKEKKDPVTFDPVSYTHLTLPTIYSV